MIKKIIHKSTIIVFLLFTLATLSVHAQDQFTQDQNMWGESDFATAPEVVELPSDLNFTQNFGTEGSDPDDNLDPGGTETGDGGFVGSTPIGDGLIPLAFALGIYIIVIYAKKKKENLTSDNV